jgi:hypothetical protein
MNVSVSGVMLGTQAPLLHLFRGMTRQDVGFRHAIGKAEASTEGFAGPMASLDTYPLIFPGESWYLRLTSVARVNTSATWSTSRHR